MLFYKRRFFKYFCCRFVPKRSVKYIILFVVVCFLLNILTKLNQPNEKLPQKVMKYLIKEGLQLFSAKKNTLKSPPKIFKKPPRLSHKLEIELETQLNNSILESVQNLKGIIYILESSYLSDPIEGFRRFISLQRLMSSIGLLTVLPRVEHGYYFTLNCTYRSAGVHNSLPINTYFNIESLQHIMTSYNLMPFISRAFAKNRIFPILTIVFFVYDEDIVEIPNPPQNGFSRTPNQEYSFFYRDTIMKHSYATDCGYYLKDLSNCILNQLIELNGFEYHTPNILCIDAMRPVTLEYFFKELKLIDNNNNNNNNTVVFVNWRGYQDPTHNKMDQKLTLSQPIHDYIHIIPFSSLVTQATEKFLSSLWYPYYSYLTVVIDLETLLDLKIKLTTNEFNICIDKLYNFYNYIRFINHGYYRLIITNAFHPFSLEFDNYYNNTLYELVWNKFSQGYTPMVSSHDDLFPEIRDFGLSYLVDINLVRYSGTTIALNSKTGSRSLYYYYYDNHVNDFSVSFHEFHC